MEIEGFLDILPEVGDEFRKANVKVATVRFDSTRFASVELMAGGRLYQTVYVENSNDGCGWIITDFISPPTRSCRGLQGRSDIGKMNPKPNH